MTATLLTPIAQIELTPGSSIAIRDISWDDYLGLLQQMGDERSTRWTYDRGVLEIRMPGQLHEAINRILALIVFTLAEELGLDCNNFGSMTLNHPEAHKGIEPDSCFYLQNAQPGQGFNVQLGVQDAIDLAIEVDITNRSDQKLVVYQTLQVPEIWIYAQDQLKIKWLVDGEYEERSVSKAFPSIAATQLERWIEMRKISTDLTVIRSVRQFFGSK